HRSPPALARRAVPTDDARAKGVAARAEDFPTKPDPSRKGRLLGARWPMSDDLLRDDAVCREAFRRGERWAMEAVYRRYLPLIHTVVSRGFSGFRGFFDPVQRDDAVQAIFAAAFEERARLAYDG